MTSQTREFYRICLLQILDTAAGVGMTSPALRVHAAALGHDNLLETQGAELSYLADKGYVAEVPKSLSPENKRWRITAAGRDFLASNGG